MNRYQLASFVALIDKLTTIEQVTQAMDLARLLPSDGTQQHAWQACQRAMARVTGQDSSKDKQKNILQKEGM